MAIDGNPTSGSATPAPAVPAFPVDAKSDAPLARVIAIVGCDGTGKTRLAADVVTSLNAKRPTMRRYMGLVSGEAGDKIKRLPFIGVRLEQHLATKVRRAQDMKTKVPGVFTALVMYLFSVWRVLQVQRMKRLARRGVLIIAERYPQVDVPGFHYDGPGLTVDRSNNWLVQLLARRERKLYEWLSNQKTSLVPRLTIDPETAPARKPDQPLPELRDKVAIMPRIHYNGATVREIDSRMPYPEVLDAALRAIDATLSAAT